MNLKTLYQQFIHISKYARWRDEDKRRETPEETVDRYIAFMCDEQCKGLIPDDVRKELRDGIMSLDVLPSMRALMTAGPALRRDNVAAYNCSYMAIDDVAVFDELLYILMCGTGVGFSVERQNITNLPAIPDVLRKSKTVIKVEDSRIGWANSLRELISMLYQGRIPEWDVSELRPAGAKLKTFGGRSSGPAPLEALFRFCVSTFKNAAGRKLNSIECHDICCKIGEVVVAGGVRRSACISLSNVSDDRMRSAKSGEWFRTAPWRRISNNSAAYTEKPGMDVFFKEWLALYESKSGERGIFNREAAVKHMAKAGRRDPNHQFGVNPCQPGFATVITKKGLRTMAEVKIGDVVWTGSIWARVANKQETGNKHVYRYETAAGRFIGTTNHRVVQAGIKIPVDDASSIDVARVSRVGLSRSFPIIGQHVADGMVLGACRGDIRDDGTISFRAPRQLAGHLDDDVLGGLVARDPYSPSRHAYRIATTLRAPALLPHYWRVIPDKYLYGNLSVVRSFLLGLFSVCGKITSGGNVRLRVQSKRMAEQVQDMLSAIGLRSRLAKIASLAPGGYTVTLERSSEAYMNNIGFLQYGPFYRPGLRSDSEHITVMSKIRAKAYLGVHPVYSLTVDDPEHTYCTSGLRVANCGEIVLRPSGLCNLSEVVVREADTLDDVRRKVRLATILGTMQATLTNFRYLRPIWAKNAKEEALLGVSLTGVMDNSLFGGREGKTALKTALEGLRDYAIEVNQEWSERLGINPAAAVTCQKPSGCATLDTRIKTDRGVLSFAELLHINGVDPRDLRDGTWIDPTVTVQAYDKNNTLQPITKLYINGVREVFEIEDESGNTFKFTGNHRLLTTQGWKRVDELTVEAEIISFD